jgi:hypothetical protein
MKQCRQVPKTLMPAGPQDVDASKDHVHDLNWEESMMRPIAFVLATFVGSAPATAQGWEEYSYPDYAFSVAFPAIVAELKGTNLKESAVFDHRRTGRDGNPGT